MDGTEMFIRLTLNLFPIGAIKTMSPAGKQHTLLSKTGLDVIDINGSVR